MNEKVGHKGLSTRNLDTRLPLSERLGGLELMLIIEKKEWAFQLNYFRNSIVMNKLINHRSRRATSRHSNIAM